jgi:hypothetical protein
MKINFSKKFNQKKLWNATKATAGFAFGMLAIIIPFLLIRNSTDDRILNSKAPNFERFQEQCIAQGGELCGYTPVYDVANIEAHGGFDHIHCIFYKPSERFNGYGLDEDYSIYYDHEIDYSKKVLA